MAINLFSTCVDVAHDFQHDIALSIIDNNLISISFGHWHLKHGGKDVRCSVKDIAMHWNLTVIADDFEVAVEAVLEEVLMWI
jgi:hypothetical protein